VRAALVLLAGCALAAKATPLEVHYFSPEPVTAATGAEPSSAAPRARLRLGRVTASAQLRARIVRRDSPVALTVHDELRWTEPPDAYVRRALSRALFDDRPLEQIVGGVAPTLEVEVTAFEHVAEPGRDAGRVVLRYQLHDERVVLDHGLVSVERAAAGPGIELVVAAIGDAMASATAELAGRVAARLRPAP